MATTRSVSKVFQRPWLFGIVLGALLAVGNSATAQSHPPVAGATRTQPQPQQPQQQPQPNTQQRPPAQPQRQYTSPPPRKRSQRRPVRQRWHGLFSIALTHFTALGDRSFALKNNLGDKLEFEDSTGLDLFLGASSPGAMFDVGLRIAFGFGPLNRTAWQLELGNQLEPSSLLTIGPSVLFHPYPGSRIDPYFGVEALFTNLGTPSSVSEEVCDDIDCSDVSVDVPHVAYSGWSFGYVAGVRLFPSTRRKPWWVHIEAKYVQSNWTSLETSDGFVTVQQPDDMSTMNLNQLAISFGIGVAL